MNRPPDASADHLTEQIIGHAIDVHRKLGRHQPERIYREGLAVALEADGLEVDREAAFEIELYGRQLGSGAADLLVEGAVALELKAVRSVTDAHFWQLGRNVEQTSTNRGLLLNFGAATLDIRRYVAASTDR